MIPLLLLVTGCLPACAPPKQSPDAGNFPVVIPFSLDRAGSKAAVEFELPNAPDPYLSDQSLRPVFIGVRRVENKGGGNAGLKEWMRRADYMLREQLPIRLAVERWEHGTWRPVALQEQRSTILQSEPSRYWYEPVAADGIVMRLSRTTPDHAELTVVGHAQEDKAYDTFQIVRIDPPAPGRYRLQAESLQDHPAIHGLTFELVVSHYHRFGIR